MTWTDAITLLWFAAIFTAWAFIHAATHGKLGGTHDRCNDASCRQCLGETRERLRDECNDGREC